MRAASILCLVGATFFVCVHSVTAQDTSDSNSISLTVRLDQAETRIAPEIYGHFTEHLGHCIYEGIWVGEDSPIPNTRGIRNDVVAALKQLKVPVVRWPGGCFADEYHWKDGIGPRDKRPKMINTHWGGVVEDNSFGTHEFMDFCDQIDAEPFVSLNVGSGTIQEMMEWVEYMTSDADSPMANLRRRNGRDKPWKVKYLGLGNETWGCGGNMTAEYYADVYRRYNTFLKSYGGNRVFRIACGPAGDDYHWTRVMMKNVAAAGKSMQGLSLHHYTLPTGSWSGSKGKSIGFEEAQYHSTLVGALKIDEMITKHIEEMDKHDRNGKVALCVDEWGNWYDVDPGTNPGFLRQQNTLRDALTAAMNLNIFQSHAQRVKMANIAQMINVLQAVILTQKNKMILTPTYHVFEMYNVHQGANMAPIEMPEEKEMPKYEMKDRSVPAVHASASKSENGQVNLSLVNLHPNRPAKFSIKLTGSTAKSATGRILTADALDAHNTFEQPDSVKPVDFTGAKLDGETLTAELPGKSIVVILLW